MAPTTREAQRAELHKTIWRVANDLRGSVDGWDFKTYVLGMLFYRFISENLTAYLNEDERRAGLFRDYPPDFFDLIIVDECHRVRTSRRPSRREPARRRGSDGHEFGFLQRRPGPQRRRPAAPASSRTSAAAGDGLDDQHRRLALLGSALEDALVRVGDGEDHRAVGQHFLKGCGGGACGTGRTELETEIDELFGLLSAAVEGVSDAAADAEEAEEAEAAGRG